MRDRLTTQGVQAIGSTPAEFRAFLEAEIVRWEKVIRAANLKLD